MGVKKLKNHKKLQLKYQKKNKTTTIISIKKIKARVRTKIKKMVLPILQN
jgi:hypothetical protein